MAKSLGQSKLLRVQQQVKTANGEVFITNINLAGRTFLGCQVGIYATKSEQIQLRIGVPLSNNQLADSNGINQVFAFMASINRDIFMVKASSMKFPEDNSFGIMLAAELVVTPENVSELTYILDATASLLAQTFMEAVKSLE